MQTTKRRPGILVISLSSNERGGFLYGSLETLAALRGRTLNVNIRFCDGNRYGQEGEVATDSCETGESEATDAMRKD